MYGIEALNLAKSIGLRKIEAEACIALANSYMITDPEIQKEYAMEALKVTQNHKLETQEGRAHTALGNYYLHTNQHYLAHSHYKKAEKIYTQLQDLRLQSILYFNMSNLFSIINDKENLKYYASKLLEIAIKRGDHAMEIRARRLLFDKNEGQQEVDFFLDLYQKASSINSNYLYNIATVIGDIYIQLNLPHKALPFLYKALESNETGTATLNLSQVYISFAEAYALLNRADSADYFFKKTMDYPFAFDDIMMNIFRVRSIIESKKGNDKDALDYFKKFHHLSDSINKNMRTTEIARIKNWHELEQKDLENEILQQEYQKQQRHILILGIFSVLIFMSFTLSIFLYRKINQKNRELSELHATKDKLFSIIAHDLRSPVASLVSVLELTQSNTMETRSQDAVFKDISKRVDETYRLLDNLLRWAKNQMQKMVASPVSFDIQAECTVITDLLKNNASTKKITLINHTDKQNVYADKDMFSVVLRNLTTNAIKFTPEGGEVSINSELSENMVIISVKDTGIRMTQEVQDNLFKLSTTKSQLGTYNEVGTGLGLVLCADFVKANGGEIWFTSKEGEGTTFFFSLPAR